MNGNRPRINDLIPFESYVPEEGRESRLLELAGFSMRVVSGVVLSVAFLTPWASRGVEFWKGLVWAVGYGAGFGLIVAIVGAVAGTDRTRPTTEERLRELYAGDPSVVADPPADATDRMICAILHPKTLRPLGGILYVTRRGLTFQSHVYGWERMDGVLRQQFVSAEFGPPRTLVLEPAVLNLRGRVVRWLGRDKRPLLLCQSENGRFILRVPNSESAERALQICVDRLRELEAAGDDRVGMR